MPKQSLTSTAFIVLTGLALFVSPAWTQDDPLPAEILPLASRSLLLDITTGPQGGFVAVGERGHVVLSGNGADWRQAQFVPTRSTLTSVDTAAGILWAGGHDTVIIRSDDGGETWTLQNFDPQRQQPIMDIHFFNANRGIAIGAYGLALVTDDGGETWEDSLVNEEEWHNNALARHENWLIVAGEAGLSYRSDDEGETWETIEMPYPGSMFGVVADPDACFLAFGLRGNIQQSCDDGETWDELTTGTESSIMGGVVADGKTVMVGKSGLVLTRNAAGAIQVDQHSSGVDLSAVISDGAGGFLLVGEEGIHHWPELAMDGAP